jgi:hypothetical protein
MSSVSTTPPVTMNHERVFSGPTVKSQGIR